MFVSYIFSFAVDILYMASFIYHFAVVYAIHVHTCPML